MKKIIEKFLALNLPLKIVVVALPVCVVGGAIATPIIIGTNKEAVPVVAEVEEDALATANVEEETENEKETATVEETTAAESELETTVPTNETTETATETVVESTTESATLTAPVEETEVVEETEEEVENTESVEEADNGSSEGFDGTYDGVNDDEDYYNGLNTWTQKATWTASNGVTIKINDSYCKSIDTRQPAAIYYDGTEDLRPNSPFMNAVNEYIYGREGFTSSEGVSGTDRYNPEVVDVSTLHDIPVASSKKSSFEKTAEFEAYDDAFNDLYGLQVSGTYGKNPAYQLQIFNDGNSIGLTASAQGYLWEINRVKTDDGSKWVCIIRRNLSSLQWHSLQMAIRMVAGKSADSVYNEIFTQCYEDNPTFPEYNMWVTIGDCEALVVDGQGNGQAEFWFK